MKLDNMESGEIYSVTGNDCTWIVVFRRHYGLGGTYFLADIVALSLGKNYPKSKVHETLETHYLNQLFGSKNIMSFDIKNLPLYMGYDKSPLFEKLLRGVE